MRGTLQIWVVVIGTFLCVVTMTAIIGSYFIRRAQIRSRLGTGAVAAPAPPVKIIDRIDERLVRLNPEQMTKLRFELLRAGYFSLDAPKTFLITRVVLAIGLPLGGYILSSVFSIYLSGHGSLALRLALTGLLAYIGYAGPAAYIKRRQARVLESYRVAFPDFLDLLLVCVDAGLSLDAALVRIGQEFAGSAPEFATNLALLSSEMRSGRSITEALDTLSERLGLDEVKAFSMLLKQSIELGSNIGDALRTYADEMRDKRMIRAETKANLLPVKMVFPLGAFIFPVMLIVVITPALMRLASVFRILLGR
jgi:tight adherence protein C